MKINVRENHRFDGLKLEQYLSNNASAFKPNTKSLRITSIFQFQDGQSNPSFKVELQLDDHSHVTCVLRKKPPGKLLPSAHLVR